MSWSLIQEGLKPYDMILLPYLNGQPLLTGPLIAVFISCANAVVLNISVMFVMKDIGPVAQQILGELKGALACLGAVAAFGEVISWQQIMGFAVALAAAHWYNETDMEVRKEAEEAAKQQVTETRAEKA